MKMKFRRMFLRAYIAIARPVLKSADRISDYYIKRWEIDKAFMMSYRIAKIKTNIELAEEELRS